MLFSLFQLIFLLFFLFLAIFSTILGIYWLFNAIRVGVPQIPTPWWLARHMILLAGDLSGKKVVDLGCGTGRILRLARKNGAKQVQGYDFDLLGRVFCAIYPIPCTKKDFFTADLTNFDVIFTYLFPEIMKRVEKELWEPLPAGKILISHQFPLPNIKPDEIWQKGIFKIYKYIKP